MPPSTARSTPVMKELSSEARNVTAAAISSGLPLRPIGICEANWAAACSACSGVRPVVVSKAGGLDWSGAHRIHANFAVFQLQSPCAREVAHSRLTRGVGAKPWHPQHVRDRRVQDNRTAVFEEGKGLLHCKEQPLHVHVEGLVKMGLSSYRERCDCPRARVREENVDVTMFLFPDCIEPVQIFQLRDVAHDRRHVSLDEGCGLLQLFLSSPGDHDVRTFFHEALGCGQANPAASACDNRDFSRQFLSMVITHMFSRFCFSLFFMLNLRSSSKSHVRRSITALS